MPIDFELLSRKILIELDGIQHFTQVSNWNGPENVQAKDVQKIQKSVQQGYIMIHIYQEELWHDTYDWQMVLRQAIETCISDPTPRCIFISQTVDRYVAHIEQIGENVRYEVIQP